MINLIIFSKDRAFQLHGLLSSIKANCDIFDKIQILYFASNSTFDKAYTKALINNPLDNCIFFNELNFKNDLLHLITNYNSEYICFMVDDLIAYKEIDDNPLEFYWEEEEDVCFSLRLGNNIEDGRVDIKPYIAGTRWYFDWTIQKKNFNYPFSLDGHIFKTNFIAPLIENAEFKNPNELEWKLTMCVNKAPKIMSCFNQSVIFSNPVNRVSDTATAPFGKKYNYSTEELNQKFLDGYIMDLDAMDFNNIDNCHKEVEIKFKKL